jgi:hypothetical protein
MHKVVWEGDDSHMFLMGFNQQKLVIEPPNTGNIGFDRSPNIYNYIYLHIYIHMCHGQNLHLYTYIGGWS